MKNTRKSIRASYSKRSDTELSFSSEDVEAFWSRVALQNYETAHTRLDDTHAQRFSISIPKISLLSNGRLLNIWSRQGEGIPYIRNRFPSIELINVEISHIMLKQARQRFPNETFVEIDLQTICYPNDYFDCILSLEMLEHSPSPQKLLCEMSRVLKPGGQLILTCPSVLSEIYLWFADLFMHNHGEGPHRFPSTLHVKSMLANAGFRLINHQATLFLPRELGAISYKLNTLCEKIFQWFPANELGIRQLYEAYKLEGMDYGL